MAPWLDFPLSGSFEFAEVGGTMTVTLRFTPPTPTPVAWTPSCEPSLFAHYDLDAKEIVYDSLQSRDEVNVWHDQGPSGTHATTDLYGVDYRPPFLVDAGAPGAGAPAIDFRTGVVGAGLSAPFSDAALHFLRDGSPWSAQFNLLIAEGDDTYRHAIFGTGAQASTAGVFLDVVPHMGAHYVTLTYANESIVTMLRAMISAPERAHYWIAFDPEASPQMVLWRNGVRIADSSTFVAPPDGGVAAGLGLCLGKRPYVAIIEDQNHWRGRFVSLFASAITDETIIGRAAEWAHGKGWV